MSFKDFLKACSEETNSGDIASVDTTICDSSKKPRCLTKRKAVKEEGCNKDEDKEDDMEDDMEDDDMDKDDDEDEDDDMDKDDDEDEDDD